MTDLASLLAKAEKATPGPYTVKHETPEFIAQYWAVCAPDMNRSRVYSNEADADFIAACDPATIIALIRRVEAAEARADTLAQHLANVTAELDEAP